MSVVSSVAYKSIITGLYVVTVFTSQFIIGKWYTVEAIPGYLMENIDYHLGYYSGWGITPFHIITAFLLIAVVRLEISELFKITLKKFLKYKLLTTSLLGYMMVALLSSINSPYFYISFILAAQHTSLLVMLILTLHLMKNHSLKKRGIAVILSGMIVFQSVIVMIQFINQSTIGLGVEARHANGFSQAIDDAQFFRPLGTFAHANQLGIMLLMFVLLFVAFSWKERKYYPDYLYYLPFIFAGIAILLSYSRTAWLASFASLIIIVKEYRQNIVKFIKDMNWRKNRLHIFTIGLISFLIISPRIALTINSFYEGAGIESRRELIREALYAAQFNIWFGTGVGTNEATLFKYFPKGIMSKFPTAVHNAYAQVLVDSGIIATAFFILIFLSGFLIKINKTKKLEGLLLKTGLLALMIYYLFQPHIALLEFPVLGMMLGAIVALSV